MGRCAARGTSIESTEPSLLLYKLRNVSWPAMGSRLLGHMFLRCAPFILSLPLQRSVLIIRFGLLELELAVLRSDIYIQSSTSRREQQSRQRDS